MLITKGLNISKRACDVLELFSKMIKMPQQKIVDALILRLPQMLNDSKKDRPNLPEAKLLKSIRIYLTTTLKWPSIIETKRFLKPEKAEMSEYDKLRAEGFYNR